MPSKLLLRTLLTICALSGTFVLACGEDTPAAERDEDDEDEDESPNSKRDAGKGKDAGRDAGKGKDAGRNDDDDDDDAEGCTLGASCTCDEGGRGICGQAGECICATTTGMQGEPLETCPNEMTCGSVIGMGPWCLGPPGPPLNTPVPPACPASRDCSEIDLPGASCTTIFGMSFCQQPCIASAAPTPPAGSGDAGTTTGGAIDAGGSTSGSADAGRSTTNRDAGR